MTDLEINELIKLKPEQITRKLIIDLFGKKVKGYDEKNKKYIWEVKHLPSEKITLKPGMYKNNKTPIETTIGILIINLLIFQDDLYPIIGYMNETITKKIYEMIENKVSEALLNDIITSDAMVNYINRIQWLGFGFNDIFSSSMTEKTVAPTEKVEKAKDELLRKHADALKNNDIVIAANIEQELVKLAQEELKDDPGFDLYSSGSKASMGNNYKDLFIMKGPMQDSSNGEYRISTSNYYDGIDKEEMSIYADSVVTSAYAKGVGTQKGGYMAKKYFASFQSIILDDEGTDCKSTGYHIFKLTEGNYNALKYRYIIEGTKLVQLNNENKSKYIGKELKFRDPMYCTSDKVCNKCAGDLYYKLGIKNIGNTSVKVSSTLMNNSLKKMHDMSIKLHTIDIDDLVI